MSSSSTSSNTTTKKTVSFCERVMIQKVSSKRIEAEMNERWYTQDDLRTFKYEAMKTLHQMEHDSKNFNEERMKLCVRGLSTSRDKFAAKQQKMIAINTVLQAQAKDLDVGTIAELYANKGTASKQLAQELGSMDAKAVTAAPTTTTTTTSKSSPSSSSTVTSIMKESSIVKSSTINSKYFKQRNN